MEGGISHYHNYLNEPIEYANRFLDDEMLNIIVEETNKHSTQKSPNKPLNVFIMLSVYKLQAAWLYWSKTTRMEIIVTLMTYNEWELGNKESPRLFPGSESPWLHWKCLNKNWNGPLQVEHTTMEIQ